MFLYEHLCQELGLALSPKRGVIFIAPIPILKSKEGGELFEEDFFNSLPKKIKILKKGGFSSTFLPQVWEQIPDKIEFLESLSVKAGLNRNSWKSGELWSYSVIVEKED